MFKNIEIISLEYHKDKALKEFSSFPEAVKNMASSPIGFDEFYEACRDYPIFFAKDPEKNWFAIALIGFDNKNMQVDDKCIWKAGKYIPAFIRRYPFVLVKTEDNINSDNANENQQNLTLAIDADAIENLNDKNSAKAFFDNDNKPTALPQEAFNFLINLQNSAHATQSFIKDLEEWDLLIEQAANIIDKNGNTHNINGFYTVNEEKLAHLSDKKRAELCKKGAIPLITAHLISLGNIRRMSI